MPTSATLLDIAIANASDPVIGIIEDAQKISPEVQYGDTRTVKGINYKARIRTAYPKPVFRDANEGSANVRSTFELRTFECHILNPIWSADQAVADADERGASAYIAEEALATVEGAIQLLGGQFYYGTKATLGDAKGFPGLLQSYDTAMELDAQGTTANGCSSVWAVRWGIQDCQWVYGNNGSLTMNDVRVQLLQDAAQMSYSAYVQDMVARVGLHVGRSAACARIKNLTLEAGKSLTDDMLADLISMFPAGLMPDMIFMTRRDRAQLQKSRVATNATGAAVPLPRDYDGIPIYASDNLKTTEPVNLAA